MDYKLKQHQDFVGRLGDLLGLDPEKSEALAEIIEERCKELATEALDEHVNRYEHASRDRW
jgi:Mn-dependent DtxR family transcriptional regulator